MFGDNNWTNVNVSNSCNYLKQYKERPFKQLQQSNNTCGWYYHYSLMLWYFVHAASLTCVSIFVPRWNRNWCKKSYNFESKQLLEWIDSKQGIAIEEVTWPYSWQMHYGGEEMIRNISGSPHSTNPHELMNARWTHRRHCQWYHS